MILCIGTTPAAQRVMVFRSLLLDQVNRAAMTLDGPAGKSVNVAKVLRVLGEEALAVGFIGGLRGSQLAANLDELRVRHELVSVESPTRECVTVIDEQAGTITELVEESHPVTEGESARLMDLVRQRSPGCRAIVMSGTVAPGCPKGLYAECTRLAHESGALPVLDAQGEPLLLALPLKPGVVKPNRPELAATVKRELGSEEQVFAACRELHERGALRVVVTAGKGPVLAFDGRRTWRVTAPVIRAVNPIGSGDAFTAALTARLLRGEDLGEACRWGAAAGAANALRLMAGEVRREDLERLLPQVEVRTVAN